MTCPRCDGLMVEDHLLDVENPTGERWIRAWRCINCGDIVESTISLNRLVGSGGRPSPGRRPLGVRSDAA